MSPQDSGGTLNRWKGQCFRTCYKFRSENAIFHRTPSFVGVIPGGRSISILPTSGITKVTAEGSGFDWLPNVLEGTQIVFVSGDDRGMGTGGYSPTSIEYSNDVSCVPPPASTGPAGAVASESGSSSR